MSVNPHKIFKTDLEFSRDNTFLISAGNLIHKVGAAALNAQSPYDLSLDTGTCNSIWLNDLSFRDDFLMDTIRLLTISHLYRRCIMIYTVMSLQVNNGASTMVIITKVTLRKTTYKITLNKNDISGCKNLQTSKLIKTLDIKIIFFLLQ